MKYPKMNRTKEFRTSVPQLGGGVNYSVGAHDIEDNQLSAAQNLWFRSNVLTTRPALRGTSGLVGFENYRTGIGSVGAFGYIKGRYQNSMTLIDDDGTAVKYDVSDIAKDINGFVVPAGGASSEVDETTNALYFKKRDVADAGTVNRIYALKVSGEFDSCRFYEPTVMMNGRPQSSMTGAPKGTQFEPYNMLTDDFKCTFTPDGENQYYYLPETNCELRSLTYAGKKFEVEYDSELGIYTDKAGSGGGVAAPEQVYRIRLAYDKSIGCFWFCEIPAQSSSLVDWNTPTTVSATADNVITVYASRPEAELTCSFIPDGVKQYYDLPEVDRELCEVTYAGKTFKVEYNEELGIYTDKAGSGGGVAAPEQVYRIRLAYDKSIGRFWFCEIPVQSGSSVNWNTPVAVSATADDIIRVRATRREITYDTIFGMRFGTWFGGGTSRAGGTRLFVSGNPDFPGVVYWSSLNNPLYFPENNYAYVGDKSSPVTAFAKQSDMLIIFKDRETFYMTYSRGSTVSGEDLEAQTVIDIEATAAVFPICQIHPHIGCDCPGTIQSCNNRLVWLSSDGFVYGLFSSGVYNERNIRRLSRNLGDELAKFSKSELCEATATCYREQYLLSVGEHEVYAMDYSSNGFQYYGSYSSDEKAQKSIAWNHWNFTMIIVGLLRARDAAIVLARDGNTSQSICGYVFDETMEKDQGYNYNDAAYTRAYDIPVMLCTKQFDFGYHERLKRVNSLQLRVSGSQGEQVLLSYHDGDRDYPYADVIQLSGKSPEDIRPVRITPNLIRVQKCGFTLNATGRIQVGGFTLRYSMMGDIR